MAKIVSLISKNTYTPDGVVRVENLKFPKGIDPQCIDDLIAHADALNAAKEANEEYVLWAYCPTDIPEEPFDKKAQDLSILEAIENSPYYVACDDCLLIPADEQKPTPLGAVREFLKDIKGYDDSRVWEIQPLDPDKAAGIKSSPFTYLATDDVRTSYILRRLQFGDADDGGLYVSFNFYD